MYVETYLSSHRGFLLRRFFHLYSLNFLNYLVDVDINTQLLYMYAPQVGKNKSALFVYHFSNRHLVLTLF